MEYMLGLYRWGSTNGGLQKYSSARMFCLADIILYIVVFEYING